MDFSYGIRNFRIFDDVETVFNFKPITILTGCNSSGKSSIVKSLLFLKEYIKKANEDYIRTNSFRGAEYNVDFTNLDLNLKSFDSTINRFNKNEPMVFSYTMPFFCHKYKIDLIFGPKQNDLFNSAWLKSLNIYDTTGGLVFSAEVKKDMLYPTKVDLSFILLEFELIIVAANYLYMNNKRDEFVLEAQEGDTEQYNYWTKEMEQFEKSLYPDLSEDERGARFYYIGKIIKYLSKQDSDFKQRYHNLLGKDSSGKDCDYRIGSEIARNTYVFFYYPVLKQINDIKKNEIERFLREIKINDDLMSKEEQDRIIHKISEGFKSSQSKDFINYYCDLETEQMSDLWPSNPSFLVGSLKKDLLRGLKNYLSMIYTFDPSNNYLKSDFGDVYRFLSCWQLSENRQCPGITECNYSHPSIFTSSKHLYFNAILDCLEIFLKMVLYPSSFSRLNYIGNFQSGIKRLYSFDDNSNNLGNTLKDYIELKGKLDIIHNSEKHYMANQKLYIPGTFINKWINKLDIGRKLLIDEDSDGLGAKLYIIKKGSRDKYPLADEGYGISQIVNFLLHIENEILTNKLFEDRVKLRDPFNPNLETYIDGSLVVDLPTATLAIEEPEVSLHPSLQSQLANIFCDAYNNYGIEFIIETHSEYLIRRTQAIIANMKTQEDFDNRPFAVYYMTKNGKSYELEYSKSGRFTNSFGPGFFDEANRSSIEILKRERRMNHER